jgi:hypothetical protein
MIKASLTKSNQFTKIIYTSSVNVIKNYNKETKINQVWKTKFSNDPSAGS